MGVRPFYYHFAPGRLFVFGSETSAVLSHPSVPGSVDEGRIADALVGTLEGINNRCTFYQSIARLPPAHSLTLKNTRLQLRRYWNVVGQEPAGLPKSESDWIEALHSQLVEAVRRRLRSSERVGSMLSGGVDSSAVVAVASELLRAEARAPLATFSAINTVGDCIETRSAISMIRFTGADATTIDVSTSENATALLGEGYRHCEEPFDGVMPLIQSIYAAAAGAGIRALMDGMPADNLYTTNQHAQRLARRHQWAAAYKWALGDHREAGMSRPRLRAVRSVAGALLPSSIRHLRSRRSEQRFVDSELIGQSLISREFANQVRLRDRLSALRSDMERSVEMDASGTAFSSMTAAYITAAVERYGRMAARWGVEPRHPFLDRDLIEFHAWLPMELRRQNGWRKWALRQAMKNEVPQEVVSRHRTGHLGSTLAMRAIGPVLSDELTLASVLNTLGGRVDRPKVETAVQCWRETANESAFGMLHNASLVGWWLQNASSRRAEPIVNEVAVYI
jgi:asparagine synthase (glutamine-hydrolysing)